MKILGVDNTSKGIDISFVHETGSRSIGGTLRLKLDKSDRGLLYGLLIDHDNFMDTIASILNSNLKGVELQ